MSVSTQINYATMFAYCMEQARKKGYRLVINPSHFAEGNYGRLFHASHSNHPSKTLVLKIMHNQDDLEAARQQLAHQISVQSSMPFRICTVYESFRLTSRVGIRAILMEYAQAKVAADGHADTALALLPMATPADINQRYAAAPSLRATMDLARRSEGPLVWAYARYTVVHDIGVALRAFLSRGLAHLDLSPNNVLLCQIWDGRCVRLVPIMIDWANTAYHPSLTTTNSSIHSEYETKGTNANQVYASVLRGLEHIM